MLNNQWLTISRLLNSTDINDLNTGMQILYGMGHSFNGDTQSAKNFVSSQLLGTNVNNAYQQPISYTQPSNIAVYNNTTPYTQTNSNPYGTINTNTTTINKSVNKVRSTGIEITPTTNSIDLIQPKIVQDTVEEDNSIDSMLLYAKGIEYNSITKEVIGKEDNTYTSIDNPIELIETTATSVNNLLIALDNKITNNTAGFYYTNIDNVYIPSNYIRNKDMVEVIEDRKKEPLNSYINFISNNISYILATRILSLVDALYDINYFHSLKIDTDGYLSVMQSIEEIKSYITNKKQIKKEVMLEELLNNLYTNIRDIHKISVSNNSVTLEISLKTLLILDLDISKDILDCKDNIILITKYSFPWLFNAISNVEDIRQIIVLNNLGMENRYYIKQFTKDNTKFISLTRY